MGFVDRQRDAQEDFDRNTFLNPDYVPPVPPPTTVGKSGLTQEEVGALPQWDFMRKFATGELGQELPEQSRFLTENMKYTFEPYFQQATANTYKRGFTSDGTSLPKAYEPLYKASVSGLGESLSALKYKEDESKRLWESLRIQEEYGIRMTDEQERQGEYVRTDQGLDFFSDIGVPVALMLAQQAIAPGTPPVV